MVELTRDMVEAAMDQCDALGVTNFLAQHGFGQPREFWAVSPYRSSPAPYPAKAIAAVALGWSDINGGYSKYDSACNMLERASYVIVDQNGKVPVLSVPTLVQILEAEADQITETEGFRAARYRIGQRLFRRAVVAAWGGQCAISGLMDQSLLIASHIKPWADCESDRERLDPNNGLLLSALWDAAFDSGLVTFDKEGCPIASGKLSDGARTALQFEDAKPIRMTVAREVHMLWHRERRYNGNKDAFKNDSR